MVSYILDGTKASAHARRDMTKPLPLNQWQQLVFGGMGMYWRIVNCHKEKLPQYLTCSSMANSFAITFLLGIYCVNFLTKLAIQSAPIMISHHDQHTRQIQSRLSWTTPMKLSRTTRLAKQLVPLHALTLPMKMER